MCYKISSGSGAPEYPRKSGKLTETLILSTQASQSKYKQRVPMVVNDWHKWRPFQTMLLGGGLVTTLVAILLPSSAKQPEAQAEAEL